MKKYIAFIATFLFFASVTVFTLPMMQDDASVDLSLTEKVTIMANAGDGGDGDEDKPSYCQEFDYFICLEFENGWYCTEAHEIQFDCTGGPDNGED